MNSAAVTSSYSTSSDCPSAPAPAPAASGKASSASWLGRKKKPSVSLSETTPEGGHRTRCGVARHASAVQRCIIAPSFADIFYNNCFKNGILPIALPEADVDKLMDDAERGANAIVTVDLENQVITGPDGGEISFEIDPFKKHCLLEGLDDIGLTMEKEQAISGFEEKRRAATPWLDTAEV